MDCSPPGSSAHGISQAGILEWVAMSFSRASSQPRDLICEQVLCPVHWQGDSWPLSHQGRSLPVLSSHTCTFHLSGFAFSSCGEQGLLSSCGAQASPCGGFSCCGARVLAVGPSVVYCMGLVALQPVGSSQTRDQTRVPHVGRQILNHWTTRESPDVLNLNQVHLSVFLLWVVLLVSSLASGIKGFLFFFSPRIFMVICSTCKSMIHCELILIKGVSIRSGFIFLSPL